MSTQIAQTCRRCGIKTSRDQLAHPEMPEMIKKRNILAEDILGTFSKPDDKYLQFPFVELLTANHHKVIKLSSVCR